MNLPSKPFDEWLSDMKCYTAPERDIIINVEDVSTTDSEPMSDDSWGGAYQLSDNDIEARMDIEDEDRSATSSDEDWLLLDGIPDAFDLYSLHVTRIGQSQTHGYTTYRLEQASTQQTTESRPSSREDSLQIVDSSARHDGNENGNNECKRQDNVDENFGPTTQAPTLCFPQDLIASLTGPDSYPDGPEWRGNHGYKRREGDCEFTEAASGSSSQNTRCEDRKYTRVQDYDDDDDSESETGSEFKRIKLEHDQPRRYSRLKNEKDSASTSKD